MAFNTAIMLGLIRDQIEALTPSTQADPDDVFRVDIATRLGGMRRNYMLDAAGAIRKPRGGETCSDWQTVIELTGGYPEPRSEQGRDTPLQNALEDSEDILEALYSWAVNHASIRSFEPEMADTTDDGDGGLQISRAITVTFERS